MLLTNTAISCPDHQQPATHLGDTLSHLHTQHDGVLFVEDACGDDLEHAGEHGSQAGGLLLSNLGLLHIGLQSQYQTMSMLCLMISLQCQTMLVQVQQKGTAHMGHMSWETDGGTCGHTG